MKTYYVVTPEYEERYSSYEPTEIQHDVVCVFAENEKEAKVKGVRELRKISGGWIHQDSKRNPFTGLKVYVVALVEQQVNLDTF